MSLALFLAKLVSVLSSFGVALSLCLLNLSNRHAHLKKIFVKVIKVDGVILLDRVYSSSHLVHRLLESTFLFLPCLLKAFDFLYSLDLAELALSFLEPYKHDLSMLILSGSKLWRVTTGTFDFVLTILSVHSTFALLVFLLLNIVSLLLRVDQQEILRNWRHLHFYEFQAILLLDLWDDGGQLVRFRQLFVCAL